MSTRCLSLSLYSGSLFFPHWEITIFECAAGVLALLSRRSAHKLHGNESDAKIVNSKNMNKYELDRSATQWLDATRQTDQETHATTKESSPAVLLANSAWPSKVRFFGNASYSAEGAFPFVLNRPRLGEINLNASQGGLPMPAVTGPSTQISLGKPHWVYDGTPEKKQSRAEVQDPVPQKHYFKKAHWNFTLWFYFISIASSSSSIIFFYLEATCSIAVRCSLGSPCCLLCPNLFGFFWFRLCLAKTRRQT